MKNVPELFGSLVFNNEVMKERLPKDTYKALRRTIDMGKSLDRSIADVVANSFTCLRLQITMFYDPSAFLISFTPPIPITTIDFYFNYIVYVNNTVYGGQKNF